MSELSEAEASRKLGGAVDFLLADERVTSDKLGVVGFCMGGGFVVQLAALQEDRIAAAVPFYGVLQSEPDYVQIQASVLGHYAELDTDFAPPTAALEMGARHPGGRCRAPSSTCTAGRVMPSSTPRTRSVPMIPTARRWRGSGRWPSSATRSPECAWRSSAGTGAVGRILVRRALDAGHEVTAFARTPRKLGDLASRVRIVVGSLEDGTSIQTTIAGADAVISTMGPTRPWFRGRPLTDGMERIVAAMDGAETSRLVALSTPSAMDPDDRPHPVLDLGVIGVKTAARPAWSEIVGMAEVIRDSDLDWTLARVPVLTNFRDRGVTAGPVESGRGLTLSRGALAGFLLECAVDGRASRQAPMVCDA